MKRLTKKIMKMAMCVMVAVMLIIPSVAMADGGTFGISASSSTVAPNGTFTVSIGGQCSGRVDVTVNNGTASASKAWMDVGNPASVTITAGTSGTVTVTAVPYDGLSDPDAMEFDPGSRSVTVTIVEPEPDPEPQPDPQPQPDPEPQPDQDNSGSDDKKPTSKPDSSKPDSSKPDKEVQDEPVIDEPVEDEPVVDEPVEDEPVEDEPVVDEPAVDEPVKEPAKIGCFIHWIILIIMVIAAILTFVFRKSMMIDIAILAIAAIISVLLSALVGHCMADWIITVIGIVALAIMSIMFSRNTQKTVE